MNMTTQNNKTNHLKLLKNTVGAFWRYGAALAVSGLLFAGTASAQDRTITLDEAIKLGLDNSKTEAIATRRLNRLYRNTTRLKTRPCQQVK
jgi:outer membrane protein